MLKQVTPAAVCGRESRAWKGLCPVNITYIASSQTSYYISLIFQPIRGKKINLATYSPYLWLQNANRCWISLPRQKHNVSLVKGYWTLVWSIAVLYRGKRAVILHVCCLLHFIILLEEAAIESLIAAEEQERCLLVSVTFIWTMELTRDPKPRPASPVQQ